MDKAQAQQYAAQHGLRVIRGTLDALPGETCRILIRKGKAIVELHTVLGPEQDLVRNAYREAHAHCIYGATWATLPTEQQAAVDAGVHGYDYVY